MLAHSKLVAWPESSHKSPTDSSPQDCPDLLLKAGFAATIFRRKNRRKYRPSDGMQQPFPLEYD